MNQRIKESWMEALRSGEYPQTQGRLRDGNGFCCLGVLVDLFLKENEKEWIEDQFGYMVADIYGAEDETLPRGVMEWAGLSNSNPDVILSEQTMRISDLNDIEKLNFTSIADIIESQF